MSKKKLQLCLFLFLLSIVFYFFYFDLFSYFNFDSLKNYQDQLIKFKHNNVLLTIGLYSLIYVVITAASLPGALILTLAGGMIFGVVLGCIIILFSASVGATLAFLSARFLFRETLEKKYKNQLQLINQGIEKNGFQYVLFLRLIPAFPFFLINLCLGLSKIRVSTFFIGSLIGMLPGTIVYANAGKEFSKLETLSGILSPSLIFAFVLLGVLALIPVYFKR